MIKDTIVKFEHETLKIGDHPSFKRKHWHALIKLNNESEGNYFTIKPNGVKFNQFVGVIKVANCTIEILPKVDNGSGDNNWQGLLTKMLQKCGKLKVQTSSNAKLKKSNLNLIELYFEDFLNEVETLIHYGLIKKYRTNTGNILALKGRIHFSQNIKRNLVHKERFYTSHEVYDVDHKIHQIIAVALKTIDLLSRNLSILDKCKRVQFAFPDCKKINVTELTFKSIKIDRKVSPYLRVLELARLIILEYSPNISSGKENMISILFDMNKLWEEYVLKVLKEASPIGIKVLGKRSKLFWKSNTLEPDIILQKDDDIYIIDTKWKHPDQKASIEDLRQVYAYGRYWKSDRVMLLYPGGKPMQYANFKDGNDEEIMGYRSFVSVVLEQNGAIKLNDKMGDEIFEMLLSCPERLKSH